MLPPEPCSRHRIQIELEKVFPPNKGQLFHRHFRHRLSPSRLLSSQHASSILNYGPSRSTWLSSWLNSCAAGSPCRETGEAPQPPPVQLLSRYPGPLCSHVAPSTLPTLLEPSLHVPSYVLTCRNAPLTAPRMLLGQTQQRPLAWNAPFACPCFVTLSSPGFLLLHSLLVGSWTPGSSLTLYPSSGCGCFLGLLEATLKKGGCAFLI